MNLQEKISRIKGIMGLIVEEVNTNSVAEELLKYGESYIDKNTCDKIYQDLLSFRNAVKSGNVQLSDDDLNTLEKNLQLLKEKVVDASLMKELKCGVAKSEMKKNFEKESVNNLEKLKVNMCWFAENIDKVQLNACKTKIQPTGSQISVKSIQSVQIQLPQTVSGNFTASNCDELHAFQSTSGKVVGNMNVVVGDVLDKIYKSGINPKPTKVTVDVKGMTVEWSVIIDKSDDGKSWVGFTSRGAGCNHDIQNRATSSKFGNDVETAKEKIMSTYGESDIEIEKVNEFLYEDKINGFKQVFYRYTKPKKYPAHKDETLVVEPKVETQPQQKPAPEVKTVETQPQQKPAPEVKTVETQPQQKPATETQPSGEVYRPKVKAVNSGSYQGDYKPKVVKVGGSPVGNQ